MVCGIYKSERREERRNEETRIVFMRGVYQKLQRKEYRVSFKTWQLVSTRFIIKMWLNSRYNKNINIFYF